MSKPSLKALREQQGISLAAMAEKAGCSPSFLSRLENGRNGETIDPDLAKRVGLAYKCRIRLQAGRIVR